MRAGHLFAIGLAVLVVPFALLFVLALGPLGWIFIGGAFILAGFVALWAEDDGDDQPTKTNCPNCGSPNPIDADACGYCDTTL